MPTTSFNKPRLLFCSYHCYVDPSSGAALATRDLLELLAARGWACGVFSGPTLDFDESPPLDHLLRQHQLTFERHESTDRSTAFRLYHFLQNGIPVSLYAPFAADPRQPPTLAEGEPFLKLFEGIVERFRPDVILTYGGHWLALEVIARAKQLGLPVVFGLHNFAYTDASPFKQVDAVWVPSRFAQAHYHKVLGLPCTAISSVWDWSRIRCEGIDGKYITFVNPQPHKGVFVFARIVSELNQRRPDIPFLVVEGRSKISRLARTGLNLRNMTNLHFMANTPDPRDFYRVSKMMLMPSLWRESFGRVAAEALTNGIPVLASRRGSLPETLAEAGCLFDIPDKYIPESVQVPTAEEVEPWIDAIIKLWDDPAAWEDEHQRSLAAAQAWLPERLLPLYEELFTRVIRGTKAETRGDL
jgi:glycosyltransferase involved in cell wall biosynthesis